MRHLGVTFILFRTLRVISQKAQIRARLGILKKNLKETKLQLFQSSRKDIHKNGSPESHGSVLSNMHNKTVKTIELLLKNIDNPGRHFRSVMRNVLVSHCFIPDLKPSFPANPSHHSLSFLQDWLHGFPRLFIDISEHICFLLLTFLFSTFLVVGSML